MDGHTAEGQGFVAPRGWATHKSEALAVDDRHGASADHLRESISDDDGGILVNAEAEVMGVLCNGGEQPLQTPAFFEMLVDDYPWEEFHPRTQFHIANPQR